MLRCIERGALDSISRGPLLGFLMDDIRISLTRLSLPSLDTDPSASSLFPSASPTGAALLRSLAGTCVRELLKKSTPDVILLEPIMDLKLSVKSDFLGAVLNDLTNVRRGKVRELETGEKVTLVSADVPMEATMGYASSLRSLTQGNASYSASLKHFDAVNVNDMPALMLKIRGY